MFHLSTPTKQSSAARSGSASGPHSGRSAASASRSGSSTTPRSDGAGRPIPSASSKAVIVKHRHSGKAAKHHGVESAERSVVKANMKKGKASQKAKFKMNSQSEQRRQSDSRTKEAPVYTKDDINVSSHQGGDHKHEDDAMWGADNSSRIGHKGGNGEDEEDEGFEE